MSAFSRQPLDGVVLWQGAPDSQAAHEFVLGWMRERYSEFHTTHPPAAHLNVLRGNMGEVLAFCLGTEHDFSSHHSFPANAHDPMKLISKPDIDIVWVAFGATPISDVAVLQEIKTTAQSSLAYADELLNDYKKLFGLNPALTLRTRLDAIKNLVEFSLKRPELCPRISQLVGNSAATSPRVKLLPTLVHEQRGSRPEEKMTVIRSRLCGGGWSPDAVTAWAIGLSELDNRLLRLAMGQG